MKAKLGYRDTIATKILYNHSQQIKLLAQIKDLRYEAFLFIIYILRLFP